MMNVRILKRILFEICRDGFVRDVIYFCDEDDDCYSVNSIYKDSIGEVCLNCSDGDHEYTASQILHKLKKFDPNARAYVLYYENYEAYTNEISGHWYTEENEYGFHDAYIDCYEE